MARQSSKRKHKGASSKRKDLSKSPTATQGADHENAAPMRNLQER